MYKKKKEKAKAVGVSLKEGLRLEMRLSMQKECPRHGCMVVLSIESPLKDEGEPQGPCSFAIQYTGAGEISWLLEANHEVPIYCKNSIC